MPPTPAFLAMLQQQSPGRQAPDGPPDPLEMRVSTDAAGVTTVSVPARPLTRSEVAALRAQRSELSSQLISASGRRDELAKELRESSSGADRAGIEQRMMVLDKRIVQLESDIAQTGRQLTAAPTSLITSTGENQPPKEFGPFTGDQLGLMSGFFMVFVLFPLAFGAARLMWKRSAVAPVAPQNAETAQRLAHLTDAVDAIAIEVERVSEGQRFVTRLLSDQRGMPALGAAQPGAEPIPLGQHDAQRVPRGAGA